MGHAQDRLPAPEDLRRTGVRSAALLGLSQEALAEEAQVSRKTVVQVETEAEPRRGQRGASVRHVNAAPTGPRQASARQHCGARSEELDIEFLFDGDEPVGVKKRCFVESVRSAQSLRATVCPC